jgi:DNA-binding PadR family transcriptional regulator
MARISDDELLLIISELDEPYGVPILRAIHERIGPSPLLRIPAEWRYSVGDLYPQLHRLEQDGWLTAHASEQIRPEHGDRRRWYYRLTHFGEDRVRRYREEQSRETPGNLAVAT